MNLRFFLLIVSFTFVFVPGSRASAGEYMQLSGVIHVQFRRVFNWRAGFEGGRQGTRGFIGNGYLPGGHAIRAVSFPQPDKKKGRASIGYDSRAGKLSGRNRAFEPAATIRNYYSRR